ncbi:unnamed protein product [Hyaloperonospora brassicae]|uniref:Protein BIG1 n=1 Tax=Hyaloperonospora brassicae TaxID=162125 RepID=A0AAV0V3E0_HYABA|nr:unnamed protein product [Hyaloperonospora brassicae]
MKTSWRVALAVVLVAAASLASASTTLYPHVPLVMWSNRPIFASANAYFSSELDETAVASILKVTVLHDPMSSDNEGVFSTLPPAAPPSEVVCLYLVPTLTLENVAQLSKSTSAFVQHAVQRSASSVVVPQTTRSTPLLPELQAVQPHLVDVEGLATFLASSEGQALVSNGKTDLLVVQFPAEVALSDVDDAIATASATLLAASNGMTDFALTGNDVAVVEVEDTVARRLAVQAKVKPTPKSSDTLADIVCEANYLVGYSAAGKAFCFSHYVNITPDIMAGLLFGLLFLFLAYVGLSVLHQIQTPQRFPSQGAPRGKEF